MAKIAVITDTHLGARGGSKVFRSLFSSYYEEVFFPFIKENGIKTILHGGDFFDSRTAITVNDIDYVVNKFLPELEASGAHMYVIAGNHDVAYKNTNEINALSLLRHSKAVTIIDHEISTIRTEGDKQFVLCPWVNNENMEQLSEDIKTYATSDNILLGHFEIEGMKMHSHSKVCENGFKPELFKKYHKVLSGHFHHPSKYGNIEYIGALFHYNWMDYGDKRGFLIYDDQLDEFEYIDNPYCLFTKLDFDEAKALTVDELKESCANQIVRVVIDNQYDKVELKDLINRIEKQGPISLDTADNTILQSGSGKDDDTVVEVSDAPLESYAETFFKDDDNAGELNVLFKDILVEAQQRQKDIE